jgi:hypothetical protein
MLEESIHSNHIYFINLHLIITHQRRLDYRIFLKTGIGLEEIADYTQASFLNAILFMTASLYTIEFNRKFILDIYLSLFIDYS